MSGAAFAEEASFELIKQVFLFGALRVVLERRVKGRSTVCGLRSGVDEADEGALISEGPGQQATEQAGSAASYGALS